MPILRICPIRTATLSAIFLVFLLVLHCVIATPVPQSTSRAASTSAQPSKVAKGNVFTGKCNIFETQDKKKPINSQGICVFIMTSSGNNVQYTGFIISKSAPEPRLLWGKEPKKRSGLEEFLGNMDPIYMYTVPVSTSKLGELDLEVHLDLEALGYINRQVKKLPAVPIQGGSPSTQAPAQNAQNNVESNVFEAQARYFSAPNVQLPKTDEICTFILQHQLPGKKKKKKFIPFLSSSKSDVTYIGYMISTNPPSPHLSEDFLGEHQETLPLYEKLVKMNRGTTVYASTVTIMGSALKRTRVDSISPEAAKLIRKKATATALVWPT